MIPMLIAGGLAAYSAYQGKKASDKQQQAGDAALAFEKEKWNQGAPFREQGAALLGRRLDPNAITQAFADPGNPYAAGNTYQSPWLEAEATPPARTAQPRGAGGGGEDLAMRRARLGAMAKMLVRAR